MPTPIYNMVDTWNAGGTVFTAVKMNVTNTASAAGSKIFDWLLASNSLFNLDVTGELLYYNSLAVTGVSLFTIRAGAGNTTSNILGRLVRTDNSALGGIEYRADSVGIYHLHNSNNSNGMMYAADGIYASANAVIGWTAASISQNTSQTRDTALVRDAANVMAMRLTTTAMSYRIYRTFTDSSNYERQAFQSGAGYFEWAAEPLGTGTANIALRFTAAGTGLYQFGGGTSSFPALNRNAAALEVKLADNSAFARAKSLMWGLVDGVTAPTTVSGTATIFVDTADGDLKILFGDGVLKLIVVDT